jgi:hypothetical protein
MCSYVLCNNWMQAGYRAVLRPLSTPCMAERATRPLQHLDAHRHCRLAGSRASRAAAGRRLPTVESAFVVASPRPPNTACDVSLKTSDVLLVCSAIHIAKHCACAQADQSRVSSPYAQNPCTAQRFASEHRCRRQKARARNLNLSICGFSLIVLPAEPISSSIMVTHWSCC